MPAHSELQYSPYTPQQIFDLVADVERYPEFLPWCRAARILERGEGYMLAELIICFKHLTERYTSKVTLSPPHAIDVVMTEGPFHHLVNNWKFTQEAGRTRIDFHLDFQFRSRILDKLIGAVFAKATERMAEAFTKRADVLYGSKP